MLHQAAEIPVAGAAGGDAVPMAEPVDDAHSVVVDEVEADAHLGRRSWRAQGEHESGWSYFDRCAVSCPKPEHVRCSRLRSLCIANGRARQECPFFGGGVWLQGSMGCGSGAQGIHARHWKYANAQRRRWTLMNTLAGLLHRHFPWSLGNSTLEGKTICVRVSLLFQFARLQMPWS